MVLGRHPTCHIVLDNASVSRNHAQITQSHGVYYLEDLSSRNGTLLNGEKIEGRTPLHDGDVLSVCELSFTFRSTMPGTPPGRGITNPLERSTTGRGIDVLSEGSSAHAEGVAVVNDPIESSSILSSLDATPDGGLRLGIRPEVKLRAIIDISKVLSSSLKIDDILARILDALFKIFGSADRAFIVLRQSASDDLLVRAFKSRSEDATEPTRLSMTILRRSMAERRAILSADASSDFASSDSVANIRMRSLMCAPLIGPDDRVLGVIQVDSLSMRQQFTQDDLDLLLAVASQSALAIQNSELHASAIRQREMEKELDFATQIQLGFLPTERPALPGYEFFDYYEAARRIGGDFFDYVPLPDGRVVVLVGDVAGKGVPAALLMARICCASRYEFLAKPSPAAAVDALNAALSCDILGHRFVTLVAAVLDPLKHALTIVNAGHLPTLRRNAVGTVERVGMDTAGLPLGVDELRKHVAAEVPLQPGDAILLYTDGVTEAMNPQQDLFGAQRLSALFSSEGRTASEIGAAVVTAVGEFSEGRSQSDDICVLCIRRTY
jgi:serine phosphatase RsbU (regulator of sigma subunit)